MRWQYADCDHRDGEIVTVALKGGDIEITSRPDPNVVLAGGSAHGSDHGAADGAEARPLAEDVEVLEEAEEDEHGRKVYA